MNDVLITGGRVLVDGSPEPVAADLLLHDGRIAVIGDDAKASAEPGAVEMTIPDRTVLPGLIDCHVHMMLDGIDHEAALTEPFSLPFYRALGTLSRTLDLGITTVRDAGGADLGLKVAQARGLVDGPELLIAVNILSQTGGHADGTMASGQVRHLFPAHPGRPGPVVDGPDEMRRRVRELLRAGADVVKVCTTGGVASEADDPKHSQFDQAELDVCVRTAAANEVPVMAHAQGRDGVLTALRAGVRSIEHGIYADDECFQLMRKTGAFLVPTLLAPIALTRMVEGGGNLSEAVARKAHAVRAEHERMIRGAISAGVRIAFGTDAGVFPHGVNLEELELLRAAGMTPLAVLRAATSEAAELLGLNDRGRIAVGKRADLAIVSGDPFEFKGYADRIAGVVQAGVIVRRFG